MKLYFLSSTYMIFSGTMLFSLDHQIIENGKLYIHKQTKELITIIGSCKDVWGINNLAFAGLLINEPEIFNYFKICSKLSQNFRSALYKHLKEDIKNGANESICACINPEYYREFYVGINRKTGKRMCAHDTWLEEVLEGTSSSEEEFLYKANTF